MSTSETSYPGAENGVTIAGTFPDRDSAKRALTDLHDAGFRHVWLGVIQGDAASSADATVTSENEAEPQEQALHQALIAHGFRHDEARLLEATVTAGGAIVTVDAENDPQEAVNILRTYGGSVDATWPGSDTAQPGLDDGHRLRLREERLLIDKQRVASGEARIRKEVVAEEQSIDVPVFREELFIQRRPVSADAAPAAAPIEAEEGQEIRIPLDEERVQVQKRTVVTEQVQVGKRKVEGIEHVSDTVRHEELRVDEDVRFGT